MSESNGHTNGKPRPSPRELWARAGGDRERFQGMMQEHGWLEWDEGAGRFSRKELCTKLAWCTLPQGHEDGCVVENPRFETPVDPSHSTNPHGAKK